jgi:CubicO group peptidase (beta-lactamase class C family)
MTARLLSLPFLLAGALAARLAAADPIDDYLKTEMTARRIPGLGLAVAREGKIVRLGSYGLANVETATPVSEDSVFAIASLDKQITATGALLAQERGFLRLDDPIARWIDGASVAATVRQLLSHTAGLPDSVAAEHEGRSFADHSTEQLLEHVTHLTPHARPGERFVYSDAGLFLAQVVTERAAGADWWTFLRRELFDPLGMKSVVSMRPDLVLPHRVAAYRFEGSPAAPRLVRDRRLDVDYGPLYSDLGMTAQDFARLIAAQDRPQGGKGLTAASLAELTRETRLANGAPAGEFFQWSRYGLGVGLDDFLGEPVVLHSGHSGVGFVRFPRRQLSIVVFTNLEHPMGSDPVGLALGVAGRLEAALALEPDPSRAAELTGAAEDPNLMPLRALADDARSMLTVGALDVERVVPAYREILAEGVEGLAGRVARLGTFEGLTILRRAPLDGRRTVWFRASYALGRIDLRLSYDGDGRISRAVWWHT